MYPQPNREAVKVPLLIRVHLISVALSLAASTVRGQPETGGFRRRGAGPRSCLYAGNGLETGAPLWFFQNGTFTVGHAALLFQITIKILIRSKGNE
jgi:hypothetical protein